jgi:hypothetical protein
MRTASIVNKNGIGQIERYGFFNKRVPHSLAPRFHQIVRAIGPEMPSPFRCIRLLLQMPARLIFTWRFSSKIALMTFNLP